MEGTAPLATLCNQLAIDAAPPEHADSGTRPSRPSSSSRSAAVATLASFRTVVYRYDVARHLDGIPHDAGVAAR